MEKSTKPVGGFRFMGAYEILWGYFAFQAHLIRWYDVRVWFACHEAVARRCGAKRGVPAQYREQEIHSLVGGVGGEHVRASIRRLEVAGLLRFTEESITFATSVDDLRVNDRAGFWAMVEDYGQKNRKVPVPRRTVRLIAGGARKVLACTILGHVLRSCYLVGRTYNATGSCAVSWVARLFGLDERNVKAARKHLIEMAWLIPIKSDAWHRRKYGARGIVNPKWSRPVGGKVAGELRVGENKSESKRSPQDEFSTSKRSPQAAPIRNIKENLFERSKNQEPDSAPDQPDSGFYKKVEEGRLSNSSSLKPQTPIKPLKASTMQHVELEDLKDTNRLLRLFANAVEGGLLSSSDADRLKFVSAAERAITVGTQNPPGLFARIIRAKLWHHITQDDEDAGSRRLKEHFFENETQPSFGRRFFAPEGHELSMDAKVVAAVKRTLSRHRVDVDPFKALCREQPGWTHERWERAEAELGNFSLNELQRLSFVGVGGVRKLI